MLIKIALLLLIVSGAALAADSKGNYMVGGGAGAVSCSEFANILENAKTHGYGTMEYVTTMQGRSCQKVGKWKLGDDLFGHFNPVYERDSPIHRRHQLRMFDPAERLFGD